jgi:hypothetical protein
MSSRTLPASRITATKSEDTARKNTRIRIAEIPLFGEDLCTIRIFPPVSEPESSLIKYDGRMDQKCGDFRLLRLGSLAVRRYGWTCSAADFLHIKSLLAVLNVVASCVPTRFWSSAISVTARFAYSGFRIRVLRRILAVR